MSDLLSRRSCVGMLAVPVISAAVGAVMGRPVQAAEQVGTSDEKLLGARIYNIREFGAAGDGKTLDTAAVQKAIDQCNADKGGTVLVPAGEFIIGTIELKSNVTLHLGAQGKLRGSPRPEDYSRGNGVPPGNGNVVLISAANADNVTIEGRGTIDGDGANFYTGVGDGTGPGGRSAQTQPANVDRPHLLVFYRCTNLLLKDAFLTRSAYHCCRILNCKYVRINGIRIYNRVNKNNDGFHFNNSEYVNIVNCNIQCQDDACALFGSNKFVTVTNCSFSTRWSIFRFGGGECENITVSNCIIYDTYGCPIKIACGGRSRFENFLFSNLIMQNVTGPITLNVRSGGRRGGSTTAPADAPATQPSRAILRNIAFSNIRATTVTGPINHPDIPFDVKPYPGETRMCIVINGTGEDFIENVSFTDIQLTSVGGGTADEAARRDVPQIGGEYFQIGTPPAYGIYARNVRGLTLNNVRLQAANPDLRPAVVFDHVNDATVTGLAVEGNPDAESALRFIDTREVLLTSPRLLTKASTFLRIEGTGNEQMTIDGGNISKADRPLVAANGAQESAVKLRV